MLSQDIKIKLAQTSNAKFIEYVNSLPSNKKGIFLHDTWNAYCECRGAEHDCLFDFEDKKDLELWTKEIGFNLNGERYAMVVNDYFHAEVNIKFFSVEKLAELVICSFDDIYHYAMVFPNCFDSVLTEIVIWPILKELGLANPMVVGYDKNFINDTLLK